MSFHTFFGLTLGLSKPLNAPKGTLESIRAHVREVEAKLGLVADRFEDNPAHWLRTDFAGVDDEVLCETAEAHNGWVRHLYEQMGEWQREPVEGGETITEADAQGFWHGLELLDVPAHRWTADYYRDRMEHLYEVMRGRESEGVTFDEKALTPKQAAAVMRLFEQYLDRNDLRLDVPHGHDYLASSYDGGYDWCEGCYKPVCPDDVWKCKKRKCPLRED